MAAGYALYGSASGEVYRGGTANSLIVNSGGTFHVFDGGKLTGRVTCDSRGTISVDAGAIVDINLSQILPGAAARFDRLWNARYTITVNDDQMAGIYALVENPEGSTTTFTIVNTSDETLGIISVGETITISDTSYTLIFSDNTLSSEMILLQLHTRLTGWSWKGAPYPSNPEKSSLTPWSIPAGPCILPPAERHWQLRKTAAM